jgi:hypothetical protein
MEKIIFSVQISQWGMAKNMARISQQKHESALKGKLRQNGSQQIVRRAVETTDCNLHGTQGRNAQHIEAMPQASSIPVAFGSKGDDAQRRVLAIGEIAGDVERDHCGIMGCICGIF